MRAIRSVFVFVLVMATIAMVALVLVTLVGERVHVSSSGDGGALRVEARF